jgi:hypothetical protein
MVLVALDRFRGNAASLHSCYRPPSVSDSVGKCHYFSRRTS